MRKVILAVALWALAAVPLPALAQSTLRMVAHADLKILDPIWSTANITRNHGYMVYDVLFSPMPISRSSRRWPRNTRSPPTG